jgi:alpha-tubulin suppressor-like RCC1 family protein
LRTLFAPRLPAQALANDDDRQRMKKMNTDVYVWGEGYQVDASQEYSNFTPKKIRNFQGPDKPDIIDVAFGWYHEAYIDKEGRLYVCPKARMSSIKIAEVQDGSRNPITEVKSLPKNSKVRQVSFIRQRMFVLTDDGKLYSFII